MLRLMLIENLPYFKACIKWTTVGHKILLTILEQGFGIAGLVLMWYRSYLADRTQTFQVGSESSISFVIDCSVPQGSVLGSLKFVSYTEDLPAVIETHEVGHHLYADDTQVSDHVHLSQVAAATANIERCVASVHGWCSSKRLQLNPTKSEIIWFGTRTSLRHLQKKRC